MHVDIIVKKLEIFLNELLIDSLGPLPKFDLAFILILTNNELISFLNEFLNILLFLIGF